MRLRQHSPSSLGKNRNKNSHQPQITILGHHLQTKIFHPACRSLCIKEDIIYQKTDMNLGMNKKLDK